MLLTWLSVSLPLLLAVHACYLAEYRPFVHVLLLQLLPTAVGVSQLGYVLIIALHEQVATNRFPSLTSIFVSIVLRPSSASLSAPSIASPTRCCTVQPLRLALLL